MSVTTSIPELIESKGGIATAAELDTAWTALAEVDESVLGRLLDRTSNVFVDAYESESSDVTIDVDHELVSSWLLWTENMVSTCEMLLEKARKLEKLTASICDAAHAGGKVEFAPPFGRYGREYEPTHDALERWGLVKPKGVDA